MSECEREDFPKESYFHSFVDFAVERIFRQNKYMVSDVVSAIGSDGFNKVINENHTVFYGRSHTCYRFTTFELAIIHFQGCVEKWKTG